MASPPAGDSSTSEQPADVGASSLSGGSVSTETPWFFRLSLAGEPVAALRMDTGEWLTIAEWSAETGAVAVWGPARER